MPQTTTALQLTFVEISFEDHEVYDGDKLIARIFYEEDHLTQPWVVMVNGVEVFRRSTWQRCYDDISWHYKRGTLPVQKPEKPAATTGNEVMARVAQACKALGYELRDDGIYYNNARLKEIVYKDGTYCYVQSLPPQSDSPGESLSWLDKSFEELTPDEWLMLSEYERAQELAA